MKNAESNERIKFCREKMLVYIEWKMHGTSKENGCSGNIVAEGEKPVGVLRSFSSLLI